MEHDILFKKVAGQLGAAKGVLIIAHKKPDYDTLGASTAMLRYCQDKGIPAKAFCADKVPSKYWFMEGMDLFSVDKDPFSDPAFDVWAVFDAGDLRYAGLDGLVPRAGHKVTMVNVDHHPTNENFGDINLVDGRASSTAEIVYRFFMAEGYEVSKDTATSLLAGILFDTGHFMNALTTKGALEVGSELLKKGADVTAIKTSLLRNKPVSALRLWGDLMARLKFDERFGVASTAMLMDDLKDNSIDDEHVEGFTNFLSYFLEVPILLVLKELPQGRVKGSLRTVEDIDVSAIALAIGGGGHKKAAGFTIDGRIVEKPERWIVE